MLYRHDPASVGANMESLTSAYKYIKCVDTDYRILVSKQAKEYYTTETFTEFFAKYEGQKITLPARFLPSKEFIEYHNSKLIDF